MARPVSKSLKEYSRGLAGGMLFSLPLIYTQEVWQTGFVAGPLRLLAALGVTFASLLAYNYYAGIRRETTFAEVAIDSIEELGLAMLLAVLLLWLLHRITGEMGAFEITGQLAVEVMVTAIGISVGRAQLGSEDGDDQGLERHKLPHRIPGLLAVGMCGALLLSLNIAPTDEVELITFQAPPWKLLGLVGISMSMIFVVLYLSDFRGTHREVRHTPGEILRGGVTMYAVSLASSAFLLWFFGRLDGLGPAMIAAAVVVLGVAASLGASAGRLLLHQTESSPK
jgi:putative integral membrane protein (TIGR02587 family)